MSLTSEIHPNDGVATQSQTEKRRIKLTSKGFAWQVEKCQETRKQNCKQGAVCMKKINVLMESKETANEVQFELLKCIKHYDEAKCMHESLLKLPLPEDEIEKQSQWFKAKMQLFCKFTENVKEWLSEAGQPYEEQVQPQDSKIPESLVDVDDIRPEDSISNISFSKLNFPKAPSLLSRTSSTSSARIKVEAEKAALLERVAALKKMHLIEEQEEQLRRQKEQLALETDLAVASAKLNVLEISGSQRGSKRGSRVSNGMNSYLENAISSQLPTSKLNPRATDYIPVETEPKQDGLNGVDPSFSSQVVRPKERTEGQRYGKAVPLKANAQTQMMFDAQQRSHVYRPTRIQGNSTGHAHSQTPVPSDSSQNYILNIMQKQNDITSLLVQQNSASVLPPRDIPVFDGDPLQFQAFMRAFENGVEEKTADLSDCLHFLEQFTRGQSRDIVRSCQHLPLDQGYQRAKDLLREHFGNEFKIASAYMDKAMNWTLIKGEDVKALQAFSLFLRGCCNVTEQIMYMRELDMPSNMRSIVLKLPYKLRERWRGIAFDLQERRGQRPVFSDLVMFIETQVKIFSDPLFGNIQDSHTTTTSKASTLSHVRANPIKTPRGSSFATNVSTVMGAVDTEHVQRKSGSFSSIRKPQGCLFCTRSDHSVDKCSQFKGKIHRDKINFLKERGVCFGCLKMGHISKDCRSRLDCDVCSRKHPGILHIEKQDKSMFFGQPEGQPVSTPIVALQTCGHIGAGFEDDCVFSIVAVQVKNQKNDKILQTYAFLDPGSSGTFCTDSLAKRLNMRRKKMNILLRTMGQNGIRSTHLLSGLEVSALESNDFIELPDTFTHESMPVSKNNIPRQEDVDHWSYLSKIKVHEIDAGIDLLIGTNAAKVIEPWEVINSQGDGPYAVRTRVGWIVNGPLRVGNSMTLSGCSAVTANRISIGHIEELLVQQYNHDFNEKSSDEQVEMSREDIKFMSIMSSSVVMKDGHYSLDLPLREEHLTLPNNRGIAEQRLLSLKRKFERNEKFCEEYTCFLGDVIDQGYAEVVPADQLDGKEGKLWYIPHHGVYHPTKGKLRVVFDCGATYRGTSLNSNLLQGPDLTNSLIGVLIRFRQEPVALMSDIQAMFHQVRVSDKDVDFLRFLWWPQGDTTKTTVEYRMKVHLFGAASSPSCANYALRKTADDNSTQFPPEVVSTVKHNFYVDDCLKAMASEEEAIQMVTDLTALCCKGGFNLSKWISNSRTVLASIPEESRTTDTKGLDLDNDHLPVERALGLQWCVETDEFIFHTALRKRPSTRRGILSVVSSLYDPLGFLSPFCLPAKLLLQELCRSNITWDEPIPQSFSQQWSDWLLDLKKVAKFRVNRCIKPSDFGKSFTAQLHHFADASQDGYGTVSYLRLENSEKKVHVAFIQGKARVAPLKQTTIPRMELIAGVLAVRMDRMLNKELQLQLERSIFWTDSTTVLKYICNETKRFQTFVANRTAFIRAATDVHQWRYVGSKENPADEASRGMRADAFLANRRWMNGPGFLYRPEEEWPKPDVDLCVIDSDDPEVKRSLVVNTIVTEKESPTNCLINHFSSWIKLKTAVAWFLKLKQVLMLVQQKVKEILAAVSDKDPELQRTEVQRRIQDFKATLHSQNLSPDDHANAEKAIIGFVQHAKFKKEIDVLKRGITHVKKDSPIYKLDPVLEDGVLRVGGRLNNSAMPEDTKHPIILSKDLHVSTLILRHIHQKLGHGGRNSMLCRLREKYWITNSNTAARKVISDCVVCRRHRGKMGEQRMADLPKERVFPDEAPFTNVGVDYFGPFNVKRGRSLLKRYGVLFTCLTSRAVHLEVAYTLDTDSCINAVRRFICRRGPVSSFLSDNGTNFVGANRELKESLNALNHAKIQGVLIQDGVTWNFNTPAAPHQGGVWERLVGMVKRVLSSVLKQQTLDDEGLQTILCEVEAILNDRPITRMSDDPNDLEALTPNHILLLKRKPVLPPGLFDQKDQYARKRWKQAQYIADLFWKRWISEYVPVMQERQKWSEARRNFKPGDIVIIADATAPRGSWMMGRVLEAKPDARDLVRTVLLQTKTSRLERPITKICLLLEAED